MESEIRQSEYRPWVHRLAITLVLVTFSLIMLGGTVTSKGAGLAVPDYPKTYGYNMFLFPPSLWVGNIFWEHTHRLLGALVGMMAIGMMVMLWNTQRDRPWLRFTGVGLLGLIIVQGLMGGLRVTELSVVLAVIHGINGQLVLCLTVLVAAATSRWWIERKAAGPKPEDPIASPGRVRFAAIALFGAIAIQLVLGAVMRHNNAGNAIPDFPTMYGGMMPPLDQVGIDAAMADFADDNERFEFSDARFSPAQVGIHMSHRLWAIIVIAVATWSLIVIRRAASGNARIMTGVRAIIGLLVAQIALGITVVLSGRHPEFATAHQSMGAALLATTSLLWMRVSVLLPGDARTVTRNNHMNAKPLLVLEGANL